MALPSLERLEGAFAFYARRFDCERPSRVALQTMLRFAATHVTTEDDELAALFYACCRFPRMPAWPRATVALTVAAAHEREIALDITPEEFDRARLDIATRGARFDDVRDWIRSRTRPRR